MATDSTETAVTGETLQWASRALGVELTDPRPLGGSGRSIVCRASTSASLDTGGRPDGHGSVIVKRFLADPVPSEFARERIGLTYLEHTPTLLASAPEHGLIVMSDLGDGPTLADLLLGDSRRAALEGAHGWAEALGEMVGASHPLAATVAAELDRQQASDNPATPTSALLSNGVARLRELAGSSAISARGLERDREQIAAVWVSGPPDTTDESGRPPLVVWPGDTCPDNAIRTRSGWRFLDLEGTSVNHPALVAAYTVLPFATCWCVFDAPETLIDQMVAAFTTGLGRYLPAVVADSAWSTQVDLAAAAWILMTTALLLEPARAERRRIGPEGRPAPSGRQLLATRWRWGARRLTRAAPAVAQLCAAAVTWAERAWGPDAEPIGPYPALV